MKVVSVYGDSILKLVLEENGHYRSDRRIERAAEAELGIRIENRSYFGSTAGKALLRMRRDRENGKDFGSLCVIEFGGNDTGYRWNETAADPNRPHRPAAEPAEFQRQLGDLAACAAETGAQPVLSNLPPMDCEAYFRWITRRLPSPEPVLRWLGSPEKLAAMNEAYSTLCEETAAERKLPLLDLRSPFLEAGPISRLMCSDGVHPNAAGQDCLLEAVRRFARGR